MTGIVNENDITLQETVVDIQDLTFAYPGKNVCSLYR